MNYLDFFIIYLACGSPFGVYYFFNSRKQIKLAWLYSIAVVFVWIPYAFQLLHEKVTNKLQTKTIDFEQIEKLQKEFENFLPVDKSIISLFELREVIERYSELTQIKSASNGIPAKHEKEIFKLHGNKNVEISAQCLNRRNRQRLLFHQNLAREDFLKTVKILSKTNSEQKKLGRLSLEFVKILNDEETQTSLEKLFTTTPQTFKTSFVNILEKDLLWKQDQPKPSNAKPISMPLQTLTVTVNARKKD